MEEKQIRVELKYLYGDLGREYWKDYGVLEKKFEKSIGKGDVMPGRGYLEREYKANVLALCEGKPIGFARLDLLNQPPRIGWLYVEPELRGREATLENTPWLKKEEGYTTAQHLVKAAWLIGRRAGYEELGSVIHGETGQETREWRLSQMPNWETEVREMHEPHELLDLLKSKRGPELVRNKF